MTYHEFLAYLFDRPTTRWLAVELAVAVEEHRHDGPGAVDRVSARPVAATAAVG